MLARAQSYTRTRTRTRAASLPRCPAGHGARVSAALASSASGVACAQTHPAPAESSPRIPSRDCRSRPGQRCALNPNAAARLLCQPHTSTRPRARRRASTTSTARALVATPVSTELGCALAVSAQHSAPALSLPSHFQPPPVPCSCPGPNSSSAVRLSCQPALRPAASPWRCPCCNHCACRGPFLGLSLKSPCACCPRLAPRLTPPRSGSAFVVPPGLRSLPSPWPQPEVGRALVVRASTPLDPTPAKPAPTRL